jgi:type I restriction enzyme S subunit
MTEVRPLRAYAEVTLGRQRAPQHEEGPHMMPYLRAANVKDGSLDLSDVKEMNFSPAEQKVFSLRQGDVLVTEGSGSLGAVGASTVWSGEVQDRVCFQNTLLRLRPRPGTDPRFLAWWCRYAFAAGVFASIATGANIFHVSAERVRDLPVTYRAPTSQRAIADFLDAETTRIDSLIDRKRRLLELLDARDLVLAAMAITGRNTSAPRRPSGLDWLGDICAGWPMAPVNSQFEVQLGRMLDPERSAKGDMRPYIRNINVRWDTIDTREVAEMDFPPSERPKYRLRSGDLLINEGGAGIGRAGLWNGQIDECYFQKSVLRLRPTGEANPRWVIECMRVAVGRRVFLVDGNLATIPHVPAEALRVRRFPFPSRREQDAQLSWLGAKRKAAGEVRRLLERQTELLQERRAALITGVVTGELKISGVAA